MTRPTVGVLMIVRDEERHLHACLETLSWCDQVAVTVDDRTRDRTLAIARQFTDDVVVRPFQSMVQQRMATLPRLRTDWVWVMDADERVAPALREEIQARVADPGPYAAFRVPRRNLMLGRWVRHGGWYPDYQLRLWRRGRGFYDERHPAHEQVLVDGPIGTLNEPLIHYNYEHTGQLFAKQRHYALQEAAALLAVGVRARPQNFVLQPLREFRRRYWTLGGWRDGGLGLLLASVMAWFEFERYRLMARDGGIDWSVGRRAETGPKAAGGR